MNQTVKEPKISVLISCYNREKSLSSCLDSVLYQNFEDIEIIVVNDGSTDNSLKVLEHYAEIDSRIRIISQKNTGIGEVRNKLIEEAKGTYVIFLDSDDYLPLDTLNNFYKNSENEKYDIVLGRVNVIFDHKYKIRFFPHTKYNENMDHLAYVKWNLVAPWGWIMKRSLFENGPKFLLNYVYEDLILNYFFLKAKNAKLIRNIVYNYCRNRNGNHISIFNKEKIWDIVDIYYQLKHLLENVSNSGYLNDKEKRSSVEAILMQPLCVLAFMYKNYSYDKKISNIILIDILNLIYSFDLKIKIKAAHWKFLSFFYLKRIFRYAEKKYSKNKTIKINFRKIFIDDRHINGKEEVNFHKNSFLYINSSNEIQVMNFLEKNRNRYKAVLIHNEMLNRNQTKQLIDFILSLNKNVGIYYDNTSYDFKAISNRIHLQDFSLIYENNINPKILDLITCKRIINIFNNSQFQEISKNDKQIWNIIV